MIDVQSRFFFISHKRYMYLGFGTDFILQGKEQFIALSI